MTSNWLDFQNDFSYGLNGSRNCCTYKLHEVSLGTLTYSYTFIYSSSNNTYPSLGNSYFPGSMHISLCYTTRLDLGCCCPLHLSRYVLSWASGGGWGCTAMNNVILTKWHITLCIDIGSAWKSLKNSSSAMTTISSECSTPWFMPFFRVWIVVIASTIIVLAWLKDEEEESQKIDDFWWLAGLVL